VESKGLTKQLTELLAALNIRHTSHLRVAISCMAIGCATAIAVAQQPTKKIARLTTLAGATYTNVTLGESDAGGLHIIHSTGAATIPWAEVPEELRVSVGYDPHKVAEAAEKSRRTAQAQGPKARIGAAPDEFRRAGWAYIGQNSGQLGSIQMQFQRSNYIVTATFWGGFCHELMIMDSVMAEAPGSADLVMASKELSGAYGAFLKTVLESNAAGYEWREINLPTRNAREWQRSDNEVIARYIGGGRLTLVTKAFNDACIADSKKREKKSLDGF
jgi:hypothetical protein